MEPIKYNITRLVWINEEDYNTIKHNGGDAYTVVELMSGNVLQVESGTVYVWNNDNGWTGWADTSGGGGVGG